MKISFNWLKEHVDCPIGPDELAEKLTMTGLEVETVTAVKLSLDDIVVGKVLSVEAHSGAERLSVCRVSDGRDEFTVVCGAKNVRKGVLAPFARVGVKIPQGTVITRAKLRGIVSEGMLCSERELELGEDSLGIMILPTGCVPGADLSEAIHLSDYVIDINVTPNRPDCLSIVGVAREVAALLKKPLKVRRCTVRESSERTSEHVHIRIESGELCPRYSARFIMGVKVGPSPFWLRNRLGLVGIRTVNNVVDATNLVLIEYGQPLHAFDFKKLDGGTVVVRTARSGERIVTIDGTEHELEEGMLVIADREKPVAIAGIMGGRDSEVSEGTGDILLESAYFEPTSIRRTSKKLNLISDSSYRFERSVDYNGIIPASDRAASLVAELTGGEVCEGIIDCTSDTRRPRDIVLRLPKMNAVLNTRMSRAGARVCLERLWMGVMDSGKEALRVTVPSYRVDLRREIDLIEEVARLKGYDKVRGIAPRGIVPGGRLGESALGRKKLGEVLCALGFSEAICLSFMGEAEMDQLMWPPDSPLRRAVRLKNPVSEEFSYLRTSMLPPIMRCMELNANRGNKDVMLFELGTVFLINASGAPRQEERLALAAMGRRGNPNWSSLPPEVEFFHLKGVLEALVSGTGGAISTKQSQPASCHPGRAATLFLDGKKWGWIGEINPRVAASYGIGTPLIFAEVNPAPLLSALVRDKSYEPLKKFPAVKRDIAIVARDELEADRIVRCVRGAVPEIIESVDIFDLYKGKPIPAWEKGLALSVKLRSDKGTLAEKDIARAMKKIHADLMNLGCRIREQ